MRDTTLSGKPTMPSARGATVQVACKTCKKEFTARTADRARGWAKYCSKSCKAIKQTQRGGALKGPPRMRHDGMSPMEHKACDTCGAPAINGVYLSDGSIEWGCFLHHDTTSFMDGHGQWE